MNIRVYLAALLSCAAASLASAVPQRTLVNMSVRAQAVSGGPGALSASFTVEGAAAKKVMVRALGPALEGFSITGFLLDPVLTVYDGSGTKIAENDNWGGSATVKSTSTFAGAYSLPSDSSKDAALVLTLNPGTYTARIDAPSGSSGIALIEVYDCDATTPRLPYLSTTFTATSSTVVGFAVTGTAGSTYPVLIRGLGPALNNTGLTGTLVNPAIELFTGTTSVAVNNDWGTGNTTDLAAAAVTAGLRPLAAGSNDAALLVSLAPGPYTVLLTGGTGIATVEVAQVDADRVDYTPALVRQVGPIAGASGGSMTFSASAIGRPAPNYQWLKNGSPIAGATNALYTATSLALSDAAQYSLTLSNTAGSRTIASAPATVWAASNPTTFIGTFRGVAYSGSVYAAVGDGSRIYTSSDASTWSRITPLGTDTYRAVAYGAGRFVAVGTGGSARVSTDNGATWTFSTIGNSNQLNSVIHDGTRFVAVGNSGAVVHSTDGVTWAAGAVVPGSKFLNGIAHNAGTYVAVASDGTILTTTTVTTGTWTAQTSGTTNALNAVAYVNDRFMAVGASGTIRSSTTGLGTWTSITSGTTSGLSAVAYNANLYVVTGSGRIVTSANGTTWTNSAILSFGSVDTTAIIFAGGQFMAVGYPGAVMTSPTGAAGSWTLRGLTALQYLDALYATGRFVAVGFNASVITSSDGGALSVATPVLPQSPNAILRRVAYGAGTYVAVGDSGAIVASRDAVAWSNRSLGTSAYTAVAYGGGKFVAAGASGNYAVSSDGFDWAPGGAIGIGTLEIKGLAYGGTTPLFVAVGNNGLIFTSPNAVTWTERSRDTTSVLNSVRFVNGQFMAVGAGSTILTSPDGIVWTPRGLGLGTPSYIYDVAYGAGHYVLVKEDSTGGSRFHVSNDGVIWSEGSPSGINGIPVSFGFQTGIAYGNGSFFTAGINGIVARTLPNSGVPRILTQPDSQTIAVGGTATLTVAANGLPGTTYQWYRGASGDTSNPIASATNASYSTSLSDRYWVQVSLAGSPSVASATATVTGPAPTISVHPAHATVVLGQNATLSVSAAPAGSGTLTYQWRKYGIAISGATAAAYTIPAATLLDAGYYDVVVSQGAASLVSNSARVDALPVAAAYASVLRPRANPPRIEIDAGNITAIAVDPADGNRIYIAGEFTRIDGKLIHGVARFNANGSFDDTWTPASLIGGGAVRALLIESDGIIIGGDFTSVGALPRARLAKLNKATGALDETFIAGAGPTASVYALARQTMADSSVRYLVGGSFSNYDGTAVNRLVRIDATGARDTSFVINPGAGAGFNNDVRALLVDGAGASARIYVGGHFTSHHGVTRNRLVRLGADGAYDAAFDAGTGFGSDVRALALSGTGGAAKLYVGGLFTSFNSVTTNRNRIVGLSAAGAYDSTFAVGSGFNSDVLSLACDSTGNVYVAGNFTTLNGNNVVSNRLVRLTSAGARDTTFNSGGAGATQTVNTILLRESDSQLLAGGFFGSLNGSGRAGFARLSTAGVLDAAPAANLRRPGIVYAIEPAPGGQWYVGGTFNFVNDQARLNFARFNADLTLDTGFTLPGSGLNGGVNALAVQGDGRIVLGGGFSTFNGTSRTNIARIHSDGSLDSSFIPGTGAFNGAVSGLVILSDGRIAATGSFTTYQSIVRNRMVVLNPDASLHTAFDPDVGFTANFGTPAPLALQVDGTLLAGGSFTTFDGVTANGLVRVLPSGAMDANFNVGGAGFAASVDIRALATRTDGRILTGGGFTTYNGTARARIAALLEATGALDTGFVPNTGPNNTLTALHPMPDGKVVIGGFFGAVSSTTRNTFARLNANGTHDTSFTVPTAIIPAASINVIRPAPSGALLVGATRVDFTEFTGLGSLVLLEAAPVPAIGTQPANQPVALNGSATFNVAATGEALTYQWFKNGVAIANATNASLTVSNVQPADMVPYTVTLTNLYGSTTSASALLVASETPPVIGTHPAVASVVAGQGASFSVAASGAGLSYQWRRNGLPIAGATLATFSIPATSLYDADIYDVMVASGLSTTLSNAARLTVTPVKYAQGVTVDPVDLQIENNVSGGIYALAPHGASHFVAGGDFARVAGGGAARRLVRFNNDGTLDAAFAPTFNYDVYAVLPDGDKMIVGGLFNQANGVNRNRLVRLNADGSLDNSFNLGGTGPNSVVYVAIRQTSDGKIIIGGSFSGYNSNGTTTTVNRIARLNADGTLDLGFTAAMGGGFASDVNAVAIDSLGRIYVGGDFTTFGGVAGFNRLVRFLPSGALDTTFNIGTGFNGEINALLIDASDRLVVGGVFTTVNGATANRFVRLSPSGAVDATFAVGTAANGSVFSLAADGTAILIGGSFTSFNGTAINRLARVSETGALDTGFSPNPSSSVRAILPQSGGSVVLGGNFNTVGGAPVRLLSRVNSAGARDAALSAAFRAFGSAYALRPLPQGKVLVAGLFDSIAGTAVSNVARLNADMTVDTTFNVGGAGTNNSITSAITQGDGRIILGGTFTSYNGVTRNRIVRIEANGALDTSFNPGTAANGTINSLVPLYGGKLYATGTFTSYNGVSRGGVIRINADGSLDPDFSAGTANTDVAHLVVQSDGKVVVGGSFSAISGTSVNNLARLSATGAIDSSFTVGSGTNGVVRSLYFQPADGKIVVGGDFTTYNGATVTRLVRVSATGVLDSSFTAGTGASGTVYSIQRQEDEKLLLWGFFTNFGGVANQSLLTRLSKDGVVDSAFSHSFFGNTGFVVNFATQSPLLALANGDILAGGDKFLIGTRDRGGLVRFVAASAPVITTPPVAQTATVGASATFSVVASGGPVLTYQWLKDGGTLAGATDASLVLNNITVADAGNYSVVLTTVVGSVTSTPVALSGSNPAPAITTQPASYAKIDAGSGGSLSVTASGVGLTYQWRRFGVAIPGATNATLPLSNLGFDASGYYDVVVGAGLSSTVSAPARVDVVGAGAARSAYRPQAAFNPRVEGVGVVNAIAPLADGRYYLAGAFTSIDGAVRHGVARFNADHSLDATWSPATITGNVTELVIQSDGKLLIAGTFVWFGDFNSFRLARLNTDGSLDTSFNLGSGIGGGAVNAIALQPSDGKILIAGNFTGINNFAANRIARLNTNGTPDATFSAGAGFDGAVNAIALQSDGKIVAVGAFTHFDGAEAPAIARLTASGARDASFNAGTGFEFGPAALVIQPDDKIVAVGGFISYNGATANGIVRLDVNGTREAGFPTGAGFGGLTATVGPAAVALVGSDLLVGGSFTSYNGSGINRLIRLSGSTGAPVTTFNASLGVGANNTVLALAVQSPGGAILVGGQFGAINSQVRSAFARLSADGSQPATNVVSVRQPGAIYALVPTVGDKVIIGGQFSHVGGVSRNNIARIDATGALDPTFDPGTGFGSLVRSVVASLDGSVIVAGSFTSFNGVPTGVNRIARLSSTGAIDTAFSAAIGSGFNGEVRAVALTPRGQIVAGGLFSTFNGVTASRIARLLPTGAADVSFNAATGTGFGNTVASLVVHPDDKITVGGVFSTFNGTSSPGIARLLPTGAIDPGFAVGTGFTLGGMSGTLSVNALILRADNTIVAGGLFGRYNNNVANGIARLLPSGAPDTSFATGDGFNGAVHALAEDASGELIVAGFFNRYDDNERRSGLARLGADGRFDPSFGSGFLINAASGTGWAVSLIKDSTNLLVASPRLDFPNLVVGGLTLFETDPGLPKILAQPFGATFNAGETGYVLSVAAATSGTAQYQWRRNGVALADELGVFAGTQTDTLVFANPQAAQAGTYTVVITEGGSGSATSFPVDVLIRESKPVIVSDLEGAFGSVLQVNGAAYLSLEATGSGPITAAWTKDGSPITGGFFNGGRFYLPLSPVKISDAGLYQVTLTNSLGAATSRSLQIWVSQESGWAVDSHVPPPQPLAHVYVADGKLFAIGAQGSRLVTETGTSWEVLPQLGQNTLIDYAEGGGRRVLLGAMGFVAVSSDGATWRTTTLPTLENAQGVAFGSGLFVMATAPAGSASGRGKIFTSPDGEVWTERHMSTALSLGRPAFGGGVFLIPTSEGVLRSSNGTAWSLQANSPAIGRSVRFVNGQFYLVGSNSLLYVSTDGVAWTSRAIGFPGAAGIDYVNGKYVISGDDGLILTSTDAMTWERRATRNAFDFREVAFINGVWVTLENNSASSPIVHSVDNAQTWTSSFFVSGAVVSNSTTRDMLSMASDGSTNAVAVGEAGHVMRTTNGTAWTAVTSGVTETLERVVYGVGRYVAVGAGGRIITSTTGTTWTTVTSGTTTALDEVWFLNGRFIASGDNGVFLKSTDGTTWTSLVFPGNPGTGALTYGAGRYVAVFDGGLILTSTDATTWAATTSGTPSDLLGVTYGNGKFIAATSEHFLTSTDGLAWAAVPRPSIPFVDDSPFFLAGRFFVGADRGGFLSSVDGVTWRGHHFGLEVTDNINGIGAFAGRMFALGDTGLILSVSLAPEITQPPAGQIFAAGQPLTLEVRAADSPLGVTYQWRKDGVAISGANDSRYSLSSAQASDQGNYDVVLTNSAGSVTSAGVNFGANGGTLPSMQQQATLGQGTIVQSSSVIDLQMNVTGSGPIQVQWQKNGVNVGAPVSPDAAGIAHHFIIGATPADSGPYTAIATNAAGSTAAVANNQAQFIVNQSNWMWRHPYPTGVTMRKVAASGDGNGFFLAADRGHWARSEDGIQWSQERSVFSSIIRGYTYGNGRHLLWANSSFLVIKGEEEPVSSNLGVYDLLPDVTFGNGLFVGVSNTGGVYTSADALTWTPHASGTTESLNKIAFGGNVFVAVTESGKILRSPDGIAWSAPVTGPFANVNMLCRANDRFFIGTLTGGLASSTDGVTWTTLTSTVTGGLNDLAYANNRYVLVGNTGRILTSDDGVTWTSRTSGTTRNLTGVAFANNTWCIVGGNAGGSVLTSGTLTTNGKNGEEWTNRSFAATTASLNGIATDGTTQMVAVGATGHVIRSTDGWGWTRTTPLGIGTLNDVTYTGTTYFAAGDDGVLGSSANGSTWTTLTSGTANHLHWVGRLNGVLHVAGSAGTLLSSSNGTTWVPVATGTSEQINGAAFGGGAYVLVGASGTIRNSTNGTSWSGVTSGVAATLNEVAYGAGKFVAVGNNGTILASTNGTAWTSTGFGLPENFTHVTFTNDLFVVSGGGSGLFVSTDGLTWSARYTGNGGTQTRATLVYKQELYVVGASGSVLATTLAPSDLYDPVSVVATAGGSATFQVTPRGFVLPATYQWRRGGLAIPGATDLSYTIPSASRAEHGALYDVVITTSAGSVVSDPAMLTVASTQAPGLLGPDLSWDPDPISISTRIYTAIPLQGGGWLAAGDFVRWGTAARPGLARLNADLTLDTSWAPPVVNGTVHALAQGTDGSVYFGGEFTAVDGHLRPGLGRLSGAGLTHDAGWSPRDNAPVASIVSALAVQSDGNLLVARMSFVANSVTGTNVLRRLTPDGALDATFGINIALGSGRLYHVVTEASGSIVFAGTFSSVNGTTRNGIARVNSTGATLDTTFAGSGTPASNGGVFALSQLADGRYIVGGQFTTINGLSRNRVALLDAGTGAVNTGFIPGTGSTLGNVYAVALLTTGDIFAGGSFPQWAGTPAAGMVRLNATTGALVQALTTGAGAQPALTGASTSGRNLTAYPLAGGDVAIFGNFQSALGARRVAHAVVKADSTLSATPSALVYRTSFPSAAFLEAGDKITLLGSFDTAKGGATLGQLVRFKTDGTVDATFPGGAGLGMNGFSTFGVYRAARQGDGKYVTTGDFISHNGTTANRIVRINPDGSNDASFNAGSGPSNYLVQPHALYGGKTILAGTAINSGFTYNGTAVTGGILRLNSNGTLDTSFVTGTGFGTGAPAAILELPFEMGDDDEVGMIIAAGSFSTYNGQSVSGIVRIRSNGTRDTTFSPAGANGAITGLFFLPDARVLAYGAFSQFNGVAANRLAIISLEDGSVDPSFAASAALDGAVSHVITQADGKLIVAGDFSSGPAIRLNANGTVDPTFALHGVTGFPGGNSTRLILGDDGSVYASGSLSINYGPARSLVRFKGAPAGVASPTIALQPASGSVLAGARAVFAASVGGGTAPFTYQWNKDGAPIEGATASTYVIAAASAGSTGSYTVTVRSVVGSQLTSPAVTLTVTVPIVGTISGIVPATPAPGETVTITGTEFTGATGVSFNGLPATSFTVVSSTSITAVVPPLATSGSVIITIPSGSIVSGSPLTVSIGARLKAIVDRASVGTGENVLYANFTIEGVGNKSVLVRGVGPSLAALGVTGALADPRLAVYDATGLAIAQNDNWAGDAAIVTASVAAGANPAFAATDSKDAALLLTLAPGTYTAALSGGDQATGVGQLEVHEVDMVNRFAHVSNRSRPAAGSPSIAGFTLEGTGNKTVLIRAVGVPLVTALGASANPTLEVFQGATSLGANDDWGSNSDLTGLASATAAAGALTLTTTDSALVLNLAPGNYTVQTGNAGSAAGFVLTQVFVIDGYRPVSFPPALVSPILNRRVALGARVIFNAPVVAKPTTVTYEWWRDELVLTPDVTFGPSSLLIPSATAATGGTYRVRLNNTAGETLTATFSLVVGAHAADANGDERIDLFELTRVIELYNTRHGTIRTGRYGVDANTEDGFKIDTANDNGATVSLTRHHSADPDLNGKIDLFELTRVIELFNHRTGTVRTGQYHLQVGTEDGFAAGP